MRILEKKEARERLAKYLTSPIDINLGCDLGDVFTVLRELELEIINDCEQVSISSSLSSEAQSTLDDIIKIDGRYIKSKSLTSPKKHVYIKNKKIYYSDTEILKIFVHLTHLLDEYGCGYEEYIDRIKEGLVEFFHYDTLELERNHDSDFYQNLEKFYDDFFAREYRD